MPIYSARLGCGRIDLPTRQQAQRWPACGAGIFTRLATSLSGPSTRRGFLRNGVHFVGLVNVLNLKAGGLGALGADQIAWLKRDVSRLATSTPIVLFAPVPLWTVYPQWGWGTDDAEAALSLVKRFGSVTVLNGHIHQIMQKVEGNVSFHTAMSTAFPQPAPGTDARPGPMKVEPDRLQSVLGIADVTLAGHAGHVDQRRRCAPRHRERGEPLQAVAGPGHGPAVQRHADPARQLQLFLLAASEDAGEGCRRPLARRA